MNSVESMDGKVDNLDKILENFVDQELESQPAKAYGGGRPSAGEDLDVVPQETRETFLWETGNILGTMEQEFVLWDYIAADHPRIAQLCRMLQQLKQDFAFFGLKDPERLCQVCESTLQRFLQGDFFQTEYPERVFLRCIDVLRTTMNRFVETGEAAIVGLDDLLSALQGLIRQPIGALLMEAGLVNASVLEEALDVQKTAGEGKAPRLGEVLVQMGSVTQDQVDMLLREQASKRQMAVEAVARLDDNTKAATATAAVHEVYINGDAIARMISLVGQLGKFLDEKNPAWPLLASLQELTRGFSREFFSSLPPFFKRAVHDLGVQYNKRVHFIVEGMANLPNQQNVALMADALLDLLHNGVEHGLESVEERIAAGKQKRGRLALLAVPQHEEIWLSVEDDGRGIDPQQIAELVIRHGLVPRERAGQLNSREFFQILLQSGPQLAKNDDRLPDAGMGLLRVAAALHQVKGKMDISSRPGRGTRITLRVPKE